MDEVMTGVVAEGDRKRLFLSPTPETKNVVLKAAPTWRPAMRLPERALGFRVQAYGFTQWDHLFTERQLAALTTFSDLMPEVRNFIIKDGGTTDYANAISTYLAFAIDRLANGGCRFTRWQNSGDKVAGVFSRQAISMIWDFGEVNPFSHSTQNWTDLVSGIAKVLEHLHPAVNPGVVHQADATTTIYADRGPVIVTDPPYYDNIGYADLSDFFYIWLRPALREIYPELFAGMQVPKAEEMIATPFRFENPREHFESLLNKTLRLIRERCSPEFPSSIFYAYKQQEEERGGQTSTGWETMLNAVVRAGFQIVGTWPMRTEMANRQRSLGANALASSVILVCRPRQDNQTASRQQFLNELAQELPPALDALTREGLIAPVDLAQAAIGPGMKVYSKYGKVESFAGDPVTVRDALIAINQAIADYDQQEAGAWTPQPVSAWTGCRSMDTATAATA